MDQNKPRSRSYTQAEITKIIKQVCESYSTGGYTLESCCENAGVPSRTFRNWFKTYEDFGENVPAKWTYFAELATLYARAREKCKKYRDGKLMETVDTMLVKLVTGYDVEEIHTEAKEKIDKDGQKIIVPIAIKKIKKYIPPNANLIMFLLKKLRPEKYGDTIITTSINVDTDKYKNMTDEELEAEIERLKSDLSNPKENKK